MKLAIIGTGYVGFVSAACFADFGHDVICVDKDVEKIAQLQRGDVPIYEPGLSTLAKRNIDEGRLHFTTDLKKGVAGADIVFIAVGTPLDEKTGTANLEHIYSVSEQMAQSLANYTVVVTKSTVPVCTGDKVEQIIQAANPKAQFDVVSNPEFLREGAAIRDFKHPDRIVVGTTSKKARKIMRAVYSPLFINQPPLYFTDRRSAEMIKYAANGFLAMKVTYINEIADLCEQVGASVQQVARGIGLDKRIGEKFLHAGPGFGGSCFPKDTKALAKTAQEAGTPLQLVETLIKVNEARPLNMVDRILNLAGGNIKGKTIAILGLTFKPNTDDMREAPSIPIITHLQKLGASIKAFDPQGMKRAALLMPDLAYQPDPYLCVKDADILVFMTEWEPFRALDLARIKSLMKSPKIVDLRNIYEAKKCRSMGFVYVGVGQAHSASS